MTITWPCQQTAAQALVERIALEVQVEQDTCTEHGVFCCEQCFDMSAAGGCYAILIKDGDRSRILETDDATQFVNWLDEYADMIVDHSAPHNQWTDLSRALMRDQGGPGIEC